MKQLSSTLLAAQKGASGAPYVKAELSDYYGDRSRIRFTRHYTGSEPEGRGAVAGAGDGSLVRARVDPSTEVLYTQRVTTPGPGDDFSQWTSHGAIGTQNGVALAGGAGATVYLFYVEAGNVNLKVKTSADNGASWGSAATVTTAGGAKTHLAAAMAPSGDIVVFWGENDVVYRSRWNGSSWGTRTAWTNSVADVDGIACRYGLAGDWQVVVCGTALTSLDPKVWTCIYGDDVDQAANTWSALHELTTAAAASGVGYEYPAVENLGAWRLFFVEKYTGTQAYDRLQYATMDAGQNFNQELWSEPVAFDYTGGTGVACSSRNLGGYLWLSAPAGVWSGESPSFVDADMSADVVEASVEVDGSGGGRARVVLADPSGALADYYFGGSPSVLQRGCRLRLNPGYRTSAGAELPTELGAYWVESLEYVTGPERRLVVNARDGWWLLDRWRARRQFEWALNVKTVSQLLLFVCARAGLDVNTLSYSATMGSFKPAFTIHPGESGATAVRRLLAMVPDEVYFRGGQLVSLYPQAADDSEYEYGAGHAVVSSRYRDLGPAVNRARVVGAGVFNEAFDFAEIAAAGERVAQVLDLNLDSAGEAGDRAGYELRAAELRERGDEIAVFGVNCGQELWDVVTVNDAEAGLSSAKRRVRGLSWRYETKRGRYEMTLTLGSA